MPTIGVLGVVRYLAGVRMYASQDWQSTIWVVCVMKSFKLFEEEYMAPRAGDDVCMNNEDDDKSSTTFSSPKVCFAANKQRAHK